MKEHKHKQFWLEDVNPHNYDAAIDYLELHYDTNVAKKIVEDLKKAPIVHKKTKDILRASGLRLLDKKNIHVKENLKKIKKKKNDH